MQASQASFYTAQDGTETDQARELPSPTNRVATIEEEEEEEPFKKRRGGMLKTSQLSIMKMKVNIDDRQSRLTE